MCSQQQHVILTPAYWVRREAFRSVRGMEYSVDIFFQRMCDQH